MLGDAAELGLLVHPHDIPAAVVAAREEAALLADEVATGDGQLGRRLLAVLVAAGAAELDDVLAQVVARLPAAFIPEERDGRQQLAGLDRVRPRRELEADLAALRIAFLRAALGLRLDGGRVTEVQRTEREVAGMARHVAERARAEVVPAAPSERVIDRALAVVALALRGGGGLGALAPFRLERPLRRDAEPEVPVEIRRYRVLARGPHDTLWPDRAVRPDVDFLDRADDAGLQHLDAAAQLIGGTALVAHLRHDAGGLRQLAQAAGLPDRVRQRLLDIDMLAHLHRHRRGGRVHVVGRGDGDRVDAVLFLEEHVAEVAIEADVGEFLADFLGLPVQRVLVHIAQRADAHAGLHHLADIAAALAAATDCGEEQLRGAGIRRPRGLLGLGGLGVLLRFGFLLRGVAGEGQRARAQQRAAQKITA